MPALLLCLLIIDPAAHVPETAATTLSRRLGVLEPATRPREEVLEAGVDDLFAVQPLPAHWLRIELENRGDLDLDLSLEAPDGKTLLRVDEGWAGLGEVLVHPPLSAAPHVLRVSTMSAKAGRYALSATLLTAPGEADRLRAEALRLRHRGVERDHAGDLEAAKTAFEAAADRWQQLGELASAAAAVESLAQVETKLGELEDALGSHTRAIELRQEVEHELMAAMSLNWRGLIQRRLGHPGPARDDFEAALEIFTAEDYTRGRASSINNVGLLHQDEGDFDDAQQRFEEAASLVEGALREKRSPAVIGQLATILENLVRVETIQARPASARRLLERVEALRLEAGDSRKLTATRLEIAWQKILFHDYTGALETLDRVGDSAELDPEDLLLLHHRRGLAFEKLGRVDEALAAHRRAARTAGLGDHRFAAAGLATTWCRLAALHGGDDLQEACERSVPAIRGLADKNRLVSALYWQARDFERRGLPRQALERLEEAADLLESLREGIAGRDTRAHFFEDRGDVLRLMVDLLMRQGAGVDNAARALVASDRLRARSLLDELTAAGADPGDDDAQPNHEQRRRLLRRVEKLETLRDLTVDLTVDLTAPEPASPRLEDHLDRLFAQLDTLDQRLLKKRTGEVSKPEPVTLRDVQAQLDPETVILSLLLGENASYLWRLDPDGLESYKLPSAKTLESAARRLLAALAGGHRVSMFQTGRQLASLLFGPSLERLEGLERRRLVFIGDGALQQLPLSVLPLSADLEASSYLASRHEVVHLPSLAALARLRRREAPADPGRRAIAILADPIFHLERRAGGQPLTAEEITSLFAAAPAAPTGRPGRLPFADREAEHLAALFPASSRLLATGLDANRDLALSSQLESYAILHFASHAWADPEHPRLSALLLSEYDADGRRIDGRLRLQDLFAARWHADLVVASACETGVGGDLRFEGVGGLARGFLYAGASRAVVSLWPVSSEPTARFMDHFYRALIEEHLAPGAALVRARLALLHGAEAAWAKPSVWGAFVLVGDWRPFDLPPAPRPERP